MINQIFDTL